MNVEKIGILKVTSIEEIEEVTPANCRMPIKSIILKIPEIALKAAPGQFVMMWLKNVDEKPMGIASCEEKTGRITFAVAKIGKATSAIHQLKVHDLLGIRGPFGKGFDIKGKKIAVIAGGTGIAPCRFLTEKALEKKIDVTLFHGARSENELAYRKYFENLTKSKTKFHYKPSTDDGSYGFCGFSLQCCSACIDGGEEFDQLYSCGPEIMMYKAWQYAKERKLSYQACLADRYFKCAIGLCGQCTVDPLGLRLCIDGPVLNQTDLEQINDFGKFSRDKFGKKVPF